MVFVLNNLNLGVLLQSEYCLYAIYLIIYMKKWLFLLIFLVSLPGLRAEDVKPDSIKLSLLTCAPGEEIYALFGHTAIRYENFTRKQDFVFNYGMFSFHTPNFVMRFLMGKTDYQLGVARYKDFEVDYAMRGSSVYQQTLNLTENEKWELLRLLDENYHPSNRTYRYNYFYDNCTTRARDKIEESLEGKLCFPQQDKPYTYRDIIHLFTKGSAWDELGIDLCLGAEADVPIDERKQMFAPFFLLEYAKEATVQRGDSIAPFVKEVETVVDVEPEPISAGFFLSPLTCALLLLFVTCLMAVWSYQSGKILWIWDVLLFGSQGIGGCIIAFLFFFSVHPTVDSNWMLVVLNPIPLFYLPVMIYKAVKRRKDGYHWANVVCLTVFIICMPFIPQTFNLATIPLILSLLVCSAGHLLVYYKKESE